MSSTVSERTKISKSGIKHTEKAQMIVGRWLLTLLFGAVIVLVPDGGSTRANGGDVDLALVLGVDTSRSVDRTEYQLQRRGLADAIRRPEVIAAIRSGQLKRIAVTVVQWTDYEAQVVVVPWMIISDTQSAVRLSERVARMSRFFGGHATHIAGMIQFGSWLLGAAPFVANRKVIDISGDGYDNVTQAPGRHRDTAIAAGITVNGLVIENEENDLHVYYREFVIGGPGAFVMQAERYEDFGDAMEKKLVREISPKFLTLRQIEAMMTSS